MNKLIYLLFVILFYSCIQTSPTEKYQRERTTIIDIKDSINEILIDDILISGFANIHFICDYMIIADPKSDNKLIHLFDKNTFQHITSISTLGQGPNEITAIGDICVNDAKREFYVLDHGKRNILCYQLDSVLINPLYEANIKVKIDKMLFPDRCLYVNDTLYITRTIEVKEDNTFGQTVAEWNMTTGKIRAFGYECPKVKKKRFTLAASNDYGIYVKCYSHYDLMSICSLDGQLKYNIYGPNWSNTITDICHYNMGVNLCNNKILALYSGGDYHTNDYYPMRIHVFNLNGDYIKTLNIGHRILNSCYDKDNNRLILLFDDEIQLGYLNLDNLI